MVVNEQIKQIASRIIYMRETLELSQTDVAEKIGMPPEEYIAYETGEKDLPVSMIYSVAAALGIDATELLTGETPRMDSYAVTRRGQGASVERYKGYAFESLAANFRHRDKEPMLVTISPKDDKPELVSHGGQEFNYVLSGKVAVVLGAKTILLNEGDEVIIPTPYWTSYPEAVKLAGGVPVTVFAGADRNFEPSIEAIEAARTEHTKAIIVNTPNNPTGAVWKPETVKAIAQWAIEHHVWVISDEIYEHLNYDGAKTTYIGAAVPEVRSQLLVLNGVAKTYAMPGWRVGWMIAPVDVAKAASKLQGHMTSNVNNISQRAAIEAVSGSLDAVYEMRAAFDKRRQTIVAALNDIEGVNCPTPTGAFYAFADVTALLNKPIGTNKTTFANTSELAAALLDEGHVAAVPGEAFGAPGYLRFSYALADDDLVEGMRRMKRWVED